MDDELGIGDAQQFFGTVAPWAEQPTAIGSENIPREYLYGDVAYTGLPFTGLAGTTGDAAEDYPQPTNPQTPGAFGGDWRSVVSRIVNAAKGNDWKSLASNAFDLATSRGGIAGLAALLSLIDRPRAHGGGVSQAYAGYKPLTRTITPSQTPGAPSPIVRYAAQGGIMHAYAQGGAVRPFPMQDGGFVLTKRAVDGAGGLQGLLQRIPEAMPIRGPGHGTSDSIPATIRGPRGQTPAKVSNGEAYVAPEDVEKRGGAPAMYALMRAMERKA